MSYAPAPLPSPTYVTRPSLPPLEKFYPHLEEIWGSQILTNHGPKHQQLQEMLSSKLGAAQVRLFCNGTQALTLALQALDIKGEVLTTPFTFPATPHSIALAGAMPVFCDVDPETLCISPKAIEDMIGPNTEAILGVHVYGIPCDVSAIEAIAAKHGLKIIYDAAHAFMTEIHGTPIAEFGDATMFSFHATKLFHTVEGGCLAFKDKNLAGKLDLLRNFGILDEDTVSLVGTNAKMNELQAAMGVEMLHVVGKERAARAAIKQRYREVLEGIDGLLYLQPPIGVTDSLQYMAVRINPEQFGMHRDELYETLKAWNIFTRRYFHPLCSSFPFYGNARKSTLTAAEAAANEVLCLPLYGELGIENVERIAEVIAFVQRRRQKKILVA